MKRQRQATNVNGKWIGSEGLRPWHGNYAPYKYDLANFNTMVNPELYLTQRSFRKSTLPQNRELDT